MQLDKEMKEIAKKYSLNKKGAERLFRVKPQVFIPNTPERTLSYIQVLRWSIKSLFSTNWSKRSPSQDCSTNCSSTADIY